MKNGEQEASALVEEFRSHTVSGSNPRDEFRQGLDEAFESGCVRESNGEFGLAVFSGFEALGETLTYVVGDGVVCSGLISGGEHLGEEGESGTEELAAGFGDLLAALVDFFRFGGGAVLFAFVERSFAFCP